MFTPPDLTGAIEFLKNEEWLDAFADIFASHFRSVLMDDDDDIENTDLSDYVTTEQAVTIWMCAFCDFASIDFEDEDGDVNFIEDYLKKRGKKEKPEVKAYLTAMRRSVMSLYEVVGITPGEAVIVRDQLRGGEPFEIHDEQASRHATPGEHVATRIISLQGKNRICGGVLPFSQVARDTLFLAASTVLGKKPSTRPFRMTNEQLAGIAPSFTLAWLMPEPDVSDEAASPLENILGDFTEIAGDSTAFHLACFPLARGLKQKDVIPLLEAVPGLLKIRSRTWNWVKSPSDMSAESYLLEEDLDESPGFVSLKGQELILAANSAELLDEGIAMLQKALKEAIQAPRKETMSIAQMFEGI